MEKYWREPIFFQTLLLSSFLYTSIFSLTFSGQKTCSNIFANQLMKPFIRSDFNKNFVLTLVIYFTKAKINSFVV